MGLIHTGSSKRDRITQSLRILRSILLIGIGTASVAHANESAGENPPGLAGWSPLLGIELTVHAQELKAQGSSSFGANDSGTNTVSTLVARLQAGVATPSLAWLPGHPRLGLRAGLSFPLRETATISSTQSLGADAELGTDLSVAWKSMWHAGVDLRFAFPVAEQIVYVTPGIEYLGSRIRYESLFTFRAEPGSPAAQQAPDPRNPPTLPFAGRSSPIVHHFVGPTLELETNVADVGPVRVSAFLQGRMYWLVGDRDEESRFSGTLLGNLENGTGRIETNFIAGQVGFGIRGSF